jgi:hypothetical protein
LQGSSLLALLTEPKSAQWIFGWLKPLLATFEQFHNRLFSPFLFCKLTFLKA